MSDPPSPLRTTAQLVASVETLAAVAALVRIDSEHLDADPQVRALLEEITREALGCDLPDGRVAQQILGMTRTFLRQAEDLVADPGRRGGWQHDDPVLLQGICRLSGSVVDAFRVAAGEVDGMDDAFTRDGARLLDVGTGAGWLAIAAARAFPSLAVVGLDIHGPALALARANVAAEDLDGRIEIREQDVTRIGEASAYDVVWLPLPFLPEAILPAAMDAAARALRPGGWLVLGTFAGAGDRLSELLVALRTVRAGGRAWRRDELPLLLADAGFTDARVLPRTWAAPVQLGVGRRA